LKLYIDIRRVFKNKAPLIAKMHALGVPISDLFHVQWDSLTHAVTINIPETSHKVFVHYSSCKNFKLTTEPILLC